MPCLPGGGGRLPAPPESAAEHAGEPGPPALARAGRQRTERPPPTPPLGPETFVCAVARRGCTGRRGRGSLGCCGAGPLGAAPAVERRNLTPPTACERCGAILVRSGFERGPRRPEGNGSLGQ